MHFWSLNMKPGRPMAFGVVGDVPLLGLPGNPVAAMISTELFARPAILTMLGMSDLSKATFEATLVDEIRSKDERRHYVRVNVEKEGGEYRASLTGGPKKREASAAVIFIVSAIDFPR